MSTQPNRPSEAAVKKATDTSWDEWFTILDAAGAKDLPHTEIATLLREKHAVKPWWAQSITVAYEYHHGRRTVGETKDVGFEIGVRRTLPFSSEELWERIVTPPGLQMWLGDIDEGFRFEKGASYRTKEGTVGEIRSIVEGEKLRLTWQPADWERPSTLQLTILPAKTGATLSFHQEKLASSSERETMRSHWASILEKLTDA